MRQARTYLAEAASEFPCRPQGKHIMVPPPNMPHSLIPLPMQAKYCTALHTQLLPEFHSTQSITIANGSVLPGCLMLLVL